MIIDRKSYCTKAVCLKMIKMVKFYYSINIKYEKVKSQLKRKISSINISSIFNNKKKMNAPF